MQLIPQSPERTQLNLFHDAVIAQAGSAQLPSPANGDTYFSEITLRGRLGNCLHLLAPMLRELSLQSDGRWLTLVAPPSNLTHAWLREAGLNREAILLLHPGPEQNALGLACHALQLGRSHTVVSWLKPNAAQRRQLAHSAAVGHSQSLNICMG